MSKVIATSTERMNHDISTYNEHLGKMQAAYDAAFDAVNALNATWSGPAHEVLVEQFLQDQEVMKTLMINLRNYREELENARTEYEKCEENVRSLISSMNV